MSATKSIELVPTHDQIYEAEAEAAGGEERKNDDKKDTGPTTVFGQIKAIPANIIKQADQSSPLMLAKMPRSIGFTVAAILFASYMFGFIYQLAQLYGNCTEDNGCITCGITISESKGSTCTRLADTQLNVRSGCMSIGLPNEYDLVYDIMKNTAILVNNASESGSISAEMYDSMTRHGKIIDTVRKNSDNQMINPDATALRTFFKENYMGITDGLYNAEQIDSLDDSMIVFAGIKVLFSYISLGCALNSQDEEYPIESLTYDTETYTGFTLCGCSLQCPTTMAVVGGTMDPSIPIPESKRNGLGLINLVLPDKYVQDLPDEDNFDEHSDQRAAVEFQYYSNSEPAHCPISVFTNSPASLNGVLYECCTEKTDLTKLSETSAFAGLVLTFAIVATTIMFMPWSPKDDSVGEGLTESIKGMFGG